MDNLNDYDGTKLGRKERRRAAEAAFPSPIEIDGTSEEVVKAAVRTHDHPGGYAVNKIEGGAGQLIRIVGVDGERRRLVIRYTGDDIVVGPRADLQGSARKGFLIDAAVPVIEIYTSDEVWAAGAGPADPVSLAYLVENYNA